MVSPNDKRNPRTLQPMMPLFQGKLDSQQLSVTNVIISLGVRQTVRKIRARCTLPPVRERWDRTAPTPTSDASNSTTNCREGSGATRMGAERKQLLSLENAASAALDHLKAVLVEVKAVNGAASWLKLRIKRR